MPRPLEVGKDDLALQALYFGPAGQHDDLDVAEAVEGEQGAEGLLSLSLQGVGVGAAGGAEVFHIQPADLGEHLAVADLHDAARLAGEGDLHVAHHVLAEVKQPSVALGGDLLGGADLPAAGRGHGSRLGVEVLAQAHRKALRRKTGGKEFRVRGPGVLELSVQDVVFAHSAPGGPEVPVRDHKNFALLGLDLQLHPQAEGIGPVELTLVDGHVSGVPPVAQHGAHPVFPLPQKVGDVIGEKVPPHPVVGPARGQLVLPHPLSVEKGDKEPERRHLQDGPPGMLAGKVFEQIDCGFPVGGLPVARALGPAYPSGFAVHSYSSIGRPSAGSSSIDVRSCRPRGDAPSCRRRAGRDQIFPACPGSASRTGKISGRGEKEVSAETLKARPPRPPESFGCPRLWGPRPRP